MITSGYDDPNCSLGKKWNIDLYNTHMCDRQRISEMRVWPAESHTWMLYKCSMCSAYWMTAWWYIAAELGCFQLGGYWVSHMSNLHNPQCDRPYNQPIVNALSVECVLKCLVRAGFDCLRLTKHSVSSLGNSCVMYCMGCWLTFNVPRKETRSFKDLFGEKQKF
jgi:hypothetical protein